MNDDENLDSYIQNNPEYQKQLVKYLFHCILSEGSKIIIFSILFLRWNRFEEFGAALIFLMILRVNGGGIHCKHYINCFLLSFVMILSSILLALNVFIPAPLMIAITSICAVFGYLLVPVTSSNRPAATIAVIKKSKRHTLFVMLGLIVLICGFPDILFFHIGFWTIILHILQLLIAKIIKGGVQNA